MQSLSVDVYTGENSVGNLIQTCKQPATGTNLRFPVGEESYFQIGWLPSNEIIPKLDVLVPMSSTFATAGLFLNPIPS